MNRSALCSGPLSWSYIILFQTFSIKIICPSDAASGSSFLISTRDRKSTRLNSSHSQISYAVFCLIHPPPTSTLFPYTTLFRSVPNIVIHRHPRAFKTVHKLDEPIRTLFRPLVMVVHHFVPNILDQNHLPQRRRQRQQLFDFHPRSEEHTSELQSQSNLVCRLLLDTSTPHIYTLSLHDALPICSQYRNTSPPTGF